MPVNFLSFFSAQHGDGERKKELPSKTSFQLTWLQLPCKKAYLFLFTKITTSSLVDTISGTMRNCQENQESFAGGWYSFYTPENVEWDKQNPSSSDYPPVGSLLICGFILFNIFGKQTLNRHYHNILLISDILVKLISLLFSDFLRKILLNACFILVNFNVFANIQTHISLEHIVMFRAVVVFYCLLRIY
ncbi:hypothetical protein BY996DRAFT_8030598 [Phakopsora pachyrhizi]|nr:hypothetical protein BY996DRAFT_8030598 [Phakopsora pachyrhizi]